MAGRGRVTLAWRNLEDLFPQMLEEIRGCLELDLSNNRLTYVPVLPCEHAAFNVLEVQHGDQDVRQLRDFDRLHTLILDNNRLTSHVKFPKLPQLRTLWVNKNNISNLSIFVDHLVAATPNLRYLSMLGNDACPNYFNGGTLKQYQDYRKYVISRLRGLTQLDSDPVTDEERAEAVRLYGDLATTVAFEEAEYEQELELRKKREEEKRQRDKREAERRRAERVKKRQQRKEAARLKRERETAIALKRQEEEERRDKERAKRLGAGLKPDPDVSDSAISAMLPEVNEFDQKIPAPSDLPDIPDAGSLPSIAVADDVTDSDEWSSDEDWDE